MLRSRSKLSVQTSTRTRLARSSSLPVAFAAAIFASSCDGCDPPWYTVPVINKQTPTPPVVTGPAALAPGASGTFTVTVTFPQAISTTNNYIVRVAIFEDDVGDVRLDRSVHVPIAMNTTSGSATFTLTCVDDGAGNLSIKGDDGSNTYDAVWEIFAKIPDQDTSAASEGPRHNLTCKPQ